MKDQASLEAVRTQRSIQRDEERMALAKLLREDEEILSRLTARTRDAQDQLAEVADLTRDGRIDVRGAAARRYYASQMRREAFLLSSARDELANQIADQRRRLADADASVKAVENLIEKRAAEQAAEHARVTQLTLEDEWMAGQQSRDPVSAGNGLARAE